VKIITRIPYDVESLPKIGLNGPRKYLVQFNLGDHIVYFNSYAWMRHTTGAHLAIVHTPWKFTAVSMNLEDAREVKAEFDLKVGDGWYPKNSTCNILTVQGGIYE
jgi:hypothetical protein